VLDIATGAGHTALAFSGFAPTVVATDLTLPMLKVARSFITERARPGVRFLAADVEALPFRDQSFDVVTCRIAAHHFPAILPAVREVARVLKRGGSFLLQDILGHEDPGAAAFILEVEKRRDPSHVRSAPRVEWLAFLRAAGLTVIDDAVLEKERPWDEWTGRMRMSPEAKAQLEGFVRDAPSDCRAAFDFRLEKGRVLAFTDRMLLVRADRD
jgi:SAM-dependent methyltransferase